MSRTFTLDMRNSQDHGQPARYVTKVFDEPSQPDATASSPRSVTRTEDVVYTTPGGRKQIKLQIAREAGEIRELVIQRVPTSGDQTRLENLLTLNRESAGRLVGLVQALAHIPVEGGETSVRIDDALLRDIFADPSAMLALYARAPEKFRRLIMNDASAKDLVAVAHRREAVQRFSRLLTDPAAFEEARTQAGGSREKVWQLFLEENPWILGVSLAAQLLTSWDSNKLEQIVAGFSIAGPGKRNDALLRTNGGIRSMVFAEIKHHGTPLLNDSKYRSGCWSPSPDLTGGVTQIQQTVHIATRQIGERLPEEDSDGAETGEDTYLVRSRSYLIIGHLGQLRGETGVHRAKNQSFELYRRNLYEPEIVTFDELLARAQWHVATAEAKKDG